ncbi:MAG: hypothetical protein ACKVQU_26160 [Burkholderiales bacterium]
MSHTLSMMRRRLLSFVLLAGATASLGLASAPVHAAPTVRLAGNVTVVALSSDFAGALTALGLTADSLGLSALVDGRAYFPISSGAVDAASARGEINHLGGLRLSTESIRVELSDFVIDTTGTPKLTGLVVANGDVVGRIPLFSLALPNLSLPLTPNGRSLRVPSVGVALTDEAAKALNATFGVNAFVKGFNIGTAEVRAIIRRNASVAHLHVPRGRDSMD